METTNIIDLQQRRERPLRTPYHSLGADHEMLVPDWAQHRSVYRTQGRTLYLVETDCLDEARDDLRRLDQVGWEVHVTEDPEAPRGSRARIALTRRDLVRAA